MPMDDEHEHSSHDPIAFPDEPVLPAPAGGTQPGEVNVIFRGLFLFVERQESIDVLIPTMGRDHVYRAGAFLSETTLAQRPLKKPYLLGGVLAGKAGFDDDVTAVFRGHDYSPGLSEADVYARILLPRPMQILSIRPTKDPLAAAVDPLGLINGKRMPCVHILRYATTDITKVRLFDHEAEEGKMTHSVDGVLDAAQNLKLFKNIHIISEPETPGAVDSMHPIMGMDKVTGLIQGLQGSVVMDRNSRTKAEAHTGDLTSLGIAGIETFTLAEIQTVLLVAGLEWRNGKQFLPDNIPVGVDDPPFSCIPPVARSGT